VQKDDLNIVPFLSNAHSFQEMCSECELDGAILPSIESFQLRWKLPKVHYLFYEYFFKAVVGECIWKRLLAENKRLGTTVLEAFTQGMLANNYHAWRYDYMLKNPGITLRTEYDLLEETSDEEGANDDERIFCADLDAFEIAAPNENIRVFKLILDGQSADNEHEMVQEAAEEARKEALANASNNTRKHSKANLMLTTREDTSPRASASEVKKKKRKSMMDLKMYTGLGAKKSRRDNDKFKGWSDEGKRFVLKMTKEIKEDVDSGVHGEWEKMYRKINELVKTSDEQEEEVESGEVVDYGGLYCEL